MQQYCSTDLGFVKVNKLIRAILTFCAFFLEYWNILHIYCVLFFNIHLQYLFCGEVIKFAQKIQDNILHAPK